MVLPRGARVGLAVLALPACSLVSLDGLTGGILPPDASTDASDAHAEAAATGYAGQVLEDAPIAYWRFDDVSGTVAKDSSGHGNDAQYEGGVTLGAPGALAGDPDTAASFDGVTGFVDAGKRFGFAGQVPFSVEAWVSAHASSVYTGIVSCDDAPAGPPSEGYLLFVTPMADTVGMQRVDGDAVSTATTAATVTGAGYTHIVGVFDGVDLTVYADGEAQGTQTASFALAGAVADFVVGAEAGGTANYFAGDLDEVAVYDYALPADRVRAHYLAGVAPP